MAGMRMPARYVAEMVSDRIAPPVKNIRAAIDTDAAAWGSTCDRSRDHYIPAPRDPQRSLETCLLILRDEGEDACFRYIRTELHRAANAGDCRTGCGKRCKSAGQSGPHAAIRCRRKGERTKKREKWQNISTC